MGEAMARPDRVGGDGGDRMVRPRPRSNSGPSLTNERMVYALCPTCWPGRMLRQVRRKGAVTIPDSIVRSVGKENRDLAELICRFDDRDTTVRRVFAEVCFLVDTKKPAKFWRALSVNLIGMDYFLYSLRALAISAANIRATSSSPPTAVMLYELTLNLPTV